MIIRLDYNKYMVRLLKQLKTANENREDFLLTEVLINNRFTRNIEKHINNYLKYHKTISS